MDSGKFSITCCHFKQSQQLHWALEVYADSIAIFLLSPRLIWNLYLFFLICHASFKFFLNTFFLYFALDNLILKLCQIIILLFKVCFSVDISQPSWSWWIETNDENERKIERWSCLNGTLLFSCCHLCDKLTLLRCWNHARFLYTANRRVETRTVTVQQSFSKSVLCLFPVKI